jgi:hypothetical protein
MRGDTKVMPPGFFSENVIAITVKFAWISHTSFAIIRLFFLQGLHHFQHTFASVE